MIFFPNLNQTQSDRDHNEGNTAANDKRWFTVASSDGFRTGSETTSEFAAKRWLDRGAWGARWCSRQQPTWALDNLQKKVEILPSCRGGQHKTITHEPDLGKASRVLLECRECRKSPRLARRWLQRWVGPENRKVATLSFVSFGLNPTRQGPPPQSLLLSLYLCVE